MKIKAVFSDLIEGGFITSQNAVLLSDKCRDASLAVFQDSESGIIYVDTYFQARDSEYYSCKEQPTNELPRNDMDIADTQRRSMLLKPFMANKLWLDFGCGAGF